VCLVFACGILAVAILSRIGIGVRHVLPLFPFLAILAAQGCIRLWERRGIWRVAVSVLLLSELACSALAHPDYLSYTNALVSDSEWLSAHDIDFGQDAKRLATVLQAEHIPAVSVALSGQLDLDQLRFPPHTVLKPSTPAEGWIAVSLLRLKLDDSYRWLEHYRPVRTIGKTIRLYWIPPVTAARQGAAEVP
jgi:hypothetical protein